MVLFYVKNNNVESDITDQEANRYYPPHQTRPTNHEHSSREISTSFSCTTL